MERVKNALLTSLLLLCAAALVRYPAESAAAAREALALCLETVLPSLFPFFVLSSIAVSTGTAEDLGRALEPLMGPVFYTGGAGGAALALGLIGGYPVGARTVAELYRAGCLSKSEAEHLLSFCNNAGPGFLLGVCGAGVFGSARAGLYLYLIHVTAAVLTGLVFRRSNIVERADRRGRRPPPPRRSLTAAFPDAVRESFAAAWSVCGYVTLFAVLLRLLTIVLPARPLLLGLVELTNGVLALPADRDGFVLCAALLGWGGLSVHAQTLSVLEGSGLSARRYFAGKAAQALLSVPLALLIAGRVFG